MDITRCDPMQVDLDLADQMVAVDAAALAEDGRELSVPSGPSRMSSLQHGHEGGPVDGLWVARDGDTVVGWTLVELPRLDNRDSARIRGLVAPAHRCRGLGRRLLDPVVDLAREHARTRISAVVWEGYAGEPFLLRHGFTSSGMHPYEVRRLDLHGTSASHWRRLHDEVAEPAADYELVHVVGPTPDDLVDDLVALHDAINDAPADDDMEPDAWDADRVRTYDASMVRRWQTTYRVLARHRETGAWAGMSLLCVDEFAPGVAFQEDTTVVRAHRGHRLGLLMKTDMLLWLTAERPEISATDTWNAADNHHMIAVNERLGCRVVARNLGYRRVLA